MRREIDEAGTPKARAAPEKLKVSATLIRYCKARSLSMVFQCAFAPLNKKAGY